MRHCERGLRRYILAFVCHYRLFTLAPPEIAPTYHQSCHRRSHRPAPQSHETGPLRHRLLLKGSLNLSPCALWSWRLVVGQLLAQLFYPWVLFHILCLLM
jgi:hypothetical protein